MERTQQEYVVGLDLGQSRDWTAWTVVQRTKVGDDPATYHCGHVDRIRGVAYPQIVSHTAALVRSLLGPPRALTFEERAYGIARTQPKVSLITDYTGVGRPVADLLVAEEIGADIELATITGADQTTRGENGDWRVPKRVLASTVQVRLQTGRLTIEKTLSLAATLTAELQNFKVKISLTGHDSYGAGEEWREGNHDDLVLSLGLALWWGEHRLATWGDFGSADWAEYLANTA